MRKLQLSTRITAQVKGRKIEKPLAKRLGGKVQLNSGALPQAGSKGDVKTENELYDSKYTAAESYLLTTKTLNKIEQEALAQQRTPVLSIEFGSNNKRYMVMREQDYLAVIDFYNKNT